MASISNDPNGRRRILFKSADGKRKAIRLGKVSRRQVESVRVKIEDLVGSRISGHTPSDETSRWLASLDTTMLDKLAGVGLIAPREKVTLGDFTDRYITGRVDIKPRTKINLERCRRYLIDCFGSNRAMRDLTAGDADDFRLHLIGQGLAENTARRAIGRARQFFTAAIKRGLFDRNPFEGLAATVRSNPDRFYFVTREEAEKVIDACPDTEWQLIFALARYGGLRCPSEVLTVTWADVDWNQSRIRIPGIKTVSRTIPLFPELLPLLRDAFEQAEPGTQYVITRYRGTNQNLRTQLQRIIRRAGLEPWPKLFQNLRSTRETELAETYPTHVACRWIGNSQPVAAEHYLQLTDEHFERAVRCAPSEGDAEAAQKAAQKPAEASRNESKETSDDQAQPVVASEDCEAFPVVSESFDAQGMPPPGLEPGTRGLRVRCSAS